MKYKVRIYSFLAILFILPLMAEKPIVPKYIKYNPYFNCSISDSLPVDNQLFLQQIHQPLCAKDSLGNTYKISSFELTYAERGLYEDSSGLPQIITDYQYITCIGDTIPSYWAKAIKDRIYKGDTFHFEKIIVIGADKKHYPCAKDLKIIIK